MRKPDFCICENKDADQLRGSREADQCLCFRYMDSTIPLYLNPKSQDSSHLLWLYSLVFVGLGKNPEDRFSQNEAQMNILNVLLKSKFSYAKCAHKMALF